MDLREVIRKSYIECWTKFLIAQEEEESVIYCSMALGVVKVAESMELDIDFSSLQLEVELQMLEKGNFSDF